MSAESTSRRPVTTPRRNHGAPHGTYRDYMTGFVLAVVLTVIPFFMVMARPIESPGYTAAIVLACAFAQILVHMIFFLHMTPKAEDGWLLLSTVFTSSSWSSPWPGRSGSSSTQPEHDADAHGADAHAAGSRAVAVTGDRRLVAVAAVMLAIAGFVGLGAWQVQRLAWKRDLIARVEARLAAAPVAAPGPNAWPVLTSADAYTRVHLTGRFRQDRETAVRAVTDLGSGYWILTPLETPDFTVLVNRGFVPPERRDPASRSGASFRARSPSPLLRPTEPGRLSPRQRSRRRPLVFARCRRHRRRPRARAGRALSSTPTPRRTGGLPLGGLTVVHFAMPTSATP